MEWPRFSATWDWDRFGVGVHLQILPDVRYPHDDALFVTIEVAFLVLGMIW